MKNGNKTEYPKSKALCPAEKKRNSSSYTFQIIKRSLIIFILKKAIIVVHSFNPSTWETKAGLVSTVRFFLQQNKMSQVDNESLTRIIQRQTALLLCDMIFHTGVTSPNHSNNMQQQKLIFCCCCFKTGSHYVALVGPEFRYSLCRMALNLQSSACLCFPSTGIKGQAWLTPILYTTHPCVTDSLYQMAPNAFFISHIEKPECEFSESPPVSITGLSGTGSLQLTCQTLVITLLQVRPDSCPHLP